MLYGYQHDQIMLHVYTWQSISEKLQGIA